jgi:hypothetical protein
LHCVQNWMVTLGSGGGKDSIMISRILKGALTLNVITRWLDGDERSPGYEIRLRKLILMLMLKSVLI